MYKKRACAAGAVLGTVITSSSRPSKCIYSSHNKSIQIDQQYIFKKCTKHTNSRTDLLLGRKLRGPASRSIETLFFSMTRSERTHPPSRACFSISVTFADGKRRERWKAEESPVRPPPKTAILFGGIFYVIV